MKTPKEILNIVALGDKHKQYVKTLEIIKGIPYFRLWCIQGQRYKECYRQTLDKTWINTDYVFTWSGGWNCYLSNASSTYYYITCQDTMYECDRGKSKEHSMPFATNNKRFTDLCNYNDLKEVEGLKYIIVEEIPLDSVPYLRKWREYPDLELYTKMGLRYVARDKKFLTLKGNKRKQFITWFKNNLEDAKHNMPSYSVVLKLSKEQKPYKKYLEECDYKYYCNNIGDYIPDEYKRDTFEYLYKKVVFHDRWSTYAMETMQTYRDYIKACKELKRDIFDSSVMYPKDLKKAHDEMIAKVSEVRDKMIDLGMEQVANLLIPVKNKSLQTIIPKSTATLIDVSNKLHNCVGKLDYNKQMANCEDVIILICDLEGNYIECCELIPNEKRYKIKQLYGDHNGYAENHSECEKLVNKFISMNPIITKEMLKPITI